MRYQLTAPEIKDKLHHQFELWGLTKHRFDSEHKLLRMNIESLVKEVSWERTVVPKTREDLQRLEERLRNFTLPDTVLESVTYVLRQELAGFSSDEKEGFRFTDYIDDLGNGSPGYYPCKSGGYRIDNLFDGYIDEERLDPVKRFTSVQYTPSEWYFKLWSDPLCLAGHVFEAMVSHHVTKNMACYNCRHQNSLRWNGGLDSSSAWADMVCIHCWSLYEIKSKESDDHIYGIIQKRKLHAGSFRPFYKNQTATGKAYLILVSLTPGHTKKHQTPSHLATIHEIAAVYPVLCPESFLTDVPGRSRIRAEVHLKVPANVAGDDDSDEFFFERVAWCRVPVFTHGHFKLAKQVYRQKYGPDLIQENSAKLNAGTLGTRGAPRVRVEGDASPASFSTRNPQKKTVKNPLSNVQQGMRELKINRIDNKYGHLISKYND